MAAAACSFPISDAMVHVNSHARRELGCAFLQDSQEFLQERHSCKYFTGIRFLLNTGRDRNGLSLHLAFVRRKRKKHGQTARNFLKFRWGFLFTGTKETPGRIPAIGGGPEKRNEKRNAQPRTRSLHKYLTENAYMEPKLLDKQFLPLCTVLRGAEISFFPKPLLKSLSKPDE